MAEASPTLAMAALLGQRGPRPGGPDELNLHSHLWTAILHQTQTITQLECDARLVRRMARDSGTE
eukprot:scaffold107102_cov31-Tisochrysis_lutea.AAC.1